jgi:tetratricopeptide (TPR) repeat protein
LLRDPTQALNLASSAARTNPQAHVLDTLATAYWANGLIDDAVATEQQAIQKDPSQSTFYQLQLERFQTLPYTNDSESIN